MVGVTYPIFARLDLPLAESGNRLVLAYLNAASLLDGSTYLDPASPPKESSPATKGGLHGS
jgi:hypothetical protein